MENALDGIDWVIFRLSFFGSHVVSWSLCLSGWPHRSSGVLTNYPLSSEFIRVAISVTLINVRRAPALTSCRMTVNLSRSLAVSLPFCLCLS